MVGSKVALQNGEYKKKRESTFWNHHSFQKEEVLQSRPFCDWSPQTSPAAHSLAGR